MIIQPDPEEYEGFSLYNAHQIMDLLKLKHLVKSNSIG